MYTTTNAKLTHELSETESTRGASKEDGLAESWEFEDDDMP